MVNNEQMLHKYKSALVVVLGFLFFISSEAPCAINRKEVLPFQEIAKELQNKRLQNGHSQYLLRTPPPVRRTNSTSYQSIDSKPFFDIPVTYNKEVQSWIKYYQTTGKEWLRNRLERSDIYLPMMKKALEQKGLPQDLAYISMIESGFSAHAVSTADAVGYWQFIESTARRYNLQIEWWIDERQDFMKSTLAAASYLGDLYKMFDSWYLTASAYNMGEGRLNRLIKKYETRDFWKLSVKPDFPEETKHYIPKMLAVLLISKAPKLYGFYNLQPMNPYQYEYIHVPGGTDLYSLADHLGVDKSRLEKLNPELKMGFIPGFVQSHKIRIPKGTIQLVSQYIRNQL